MNSQSHTNNLNNHNFNSNYNLNNIPYGTNREDMNGLHINNYHPNLTNSSSNKQVLPTITNNRITTPYKNQNNLNNLQGNNDQTQLDSKQISSNTNINNTQNSLSQINSLSIINNEIKFFMKNIVDNQTQLNNKFNSLLHNITEQESNNRVNSAKITELDKKLTDVLINLNDNLKINEFYSQKVVRLEQDSKYYALKDDLNNLQDSYLSFSRNTEIKISNNSNKLSDYQHMFNHLQKEQEQYQKYSLDKFGKLSNEIVSNNSLLEETFSSLDNTLNKKLTETRNYLNEKTKSLEINLETEKELKHNQLIIMKKEVNELIKESDSKIKEVEKSLLQFEQRYISFSKEYLTQFNSIIKDYNAKLESDITKNHSIQIALFEKLEAECKSDFNDHRNSINEVKEKCLMYDSKFLELETGIIEGKKNYDKELISVNSKINSIETDFNLNKSDVSQCLSKYLPAIEFYNNKTETNREISIIKGNYIDIKKEILNVLDKTNSEMIERFLLNEKKFTEKLNSLSDNVDKIVKNSDIEGVLLDKKINLKLDVFRSTLEEYKKKILLILENKHEDTKKEYIEKESKLLKTISEKLEEKNSFLKEDLELDKNNYKLVLEGKLQGKIVELEKVINDSIEERINLLYKDLKNKNINRA